MLKAKPRTKAELARELSFCKSMIEYRLDDINVKMIRLEKHMSLISERMERIRDVIEIYERKRMTPFMYDTNSRAIRENVERIMKKLEI